MALLPVEIDIIVGIVEEPLVLFDQIAADPRRNAVAQRHIDRTLQLQAVRLEAVSYAAPARQVEFGFGRDDVDRDRKRTRLNSSHYCSSRMTSSACKNQKCTTHNSCL